MSSDRAHVTPRLRDPNARVHLDLTVSEATELYTLTVLAHATFGTRVTAVAPAEQDAAAAALNRATCKLYTELRDACRSGL